MILGPHLLCSLDLSFNVITLLITLNLIAFMNRNDIKMKFSTNYFEMYCYWYIFLLDVALQDFWESFFNTFKIKTFCISWFDYNNRFSLVNLIINKLKKWTIRNVTLTSVRSISFIPFLTFSYRGKKKRSRKNKREIPW